MRYAMVMGSSAFTLTPPSALKGPFTPLTPLVFASPHSGDVYPEDLKAREDLITSSLRSAEDVMMDVMAAAGPELGIPLIAGRLGRAYVDLNRDPAELDPRLILDAPENVSPRVSAGFGVIPRLTGDGHAIRSAPLTLAEAKERLDQVHRPYHEALSTLMHKARDRFGYALLIDWHSMPSRAVNDPRLSVRGADVVLGDRHGASCAPETTRLLRAQFERSGWRVNLNRPYAGGWSTQVWGRPHDGFHAVQVELNRALYLDEATLKPGVRHRATRRTLDRVIGVLTANDWSGLRPAAQAAE